MSKKYVGVDDSLIDFIPNGATEEDPADMTPVMVVGDPYDNAAVIEGGWDGIEEFLTRALDRLREARTDVDGWRAVVTDHLDDTIEDDAERESLLDKAMTHVIPAPVLALEA